MGSLNFNLDTSAFNTAIKEKMIELGEEIFADSQQTIVDKNIVDRGTLLNSGKFLIGENSISITYDTIHADIVEYGRAPGSFPNVTAIKEWIERKGLKATDSNGKSISTDQLAFLIGRDIKKNGIEPRPYLTPAIERARLKLKNG